MIFPAVNLQDSWAFRLELGVVSVHHSGLDEIHPDFLGTVLIYNIDVYMNV